MVVAQEALIILLAGENPEQCDCPWDRRVGDGDAPAQEGQPQAFANIVPRNPRQRQVAQSFAPFNDHVAKEVQQARSC